MARRRRRIRFTTREGERVSFLAKASRVKRRPRRKRSWLDW